MKKKSSSKKSTKQKEVKKMATQATVEEPRSKMSIAKEIYRENKDKPRKDLMKLFMEEAKLTKYGASTYIANIRKLDKEGKL